MANTYAEYGTSDSIKVESKGFISKGIYNIIGGAKIEIGKVLKSSDLNEYGIPTTIFADVIRLSIMVGKNPSFYIRFGALLDYLENQIFPKIANPNTSGTKEEQEIKIKSMAGLTGNPYLKVDTDTNTNIMYTIDNQLSTNPQVCVINNSFQNSNGSTTLFHGLEDYIGVQGDIKYGKVMNIYINTTYLNDLVASGGVASSISIYKFLNEICEDINDSLGGVNNLEPTIDEASNTIVIIEQTKIPGKDELIKTLGIRTPTPKNPPILEVFGYNGQKSNFVRNAGITTSITKEYATMITIGATAGGYIPGEEATAFSRWNIGIEDRFKKNITGPDIDQIPTTSSFDTDNEGIRKKYSEYINQDIYNLIGINPDDENKDKETEEPISGKPIDPTLIKSNTSAVVNFNKYLQASSSIANPEPKDVESSVGFLPFNLNLTMDGLGGIKIYNRLDVNTKFLPSNYPQALEFIITGVDHKLSNSSWETSLNTLGTSKGTNNPSRIVIQDLPEVERRYTRGAEFVDITPPDVDGAYEIYNGSPSRGGWGRRYRFEELGTHWPGSSGYALYLDDSKMRTNTISVLSRDKSMMVYDLVMYREEKGIKTKSCSLPSPIDGKITLAGFGKDSVTTIVGAEGTVKMLHMDKIYVKEKQIVKKGQLIGRQGAVMSSKVVNPNIHLHIQAPRNILESYITMLVSQSSPNSTKNQT